MDRELTYMGFAKLLYINKSISRLDGSWVLKCSGNSMVKDNFYEGLISQHGHRR